MGLRLRLVVMLLRWRLLEGCRMREQRRRCVEDKRRSTQRDVTLGWGWWSVSVGVCATGRLAAAAARWTSMTGPLISGHLHYARNSIPMEWMDVYSLGLHVHV